MTARLSGVVARAKKRREALLDKLRKAPTGESWCNRHTLLADGIVRGIYRVLSEEHPAAADIAIVATGGFGRKELAPGSDIDLTFIPLDELEPQNERAVRDMFRVLVDTFAALDWPVGYAYRLPSDCPALDAKTRTGLMDARLVVGSRDAFVAFARAFWDTFPVAEFLISKLEERSGMQAQWHDTPRVVEPHLREGAGGLRDLQASRWLQRALGYRSGTSLVEERELLIKVRNALHLVTGRKEDRLLRTRRQEVAKVLGTGPDELSAELMRAGEAIELEWQATKDRILTSRFPLAAGVSADRGECRAMPTATLADAAVGVCRAIRLGLRIGAISPERGVGDAPLIVECATSGETALRGLMRAGLLDALLPEFGRTRYLLSRDSVHKYSVGEHSLQVVRNLDDTRSAHEYAAAWSEVSNSRPLYLAALLHDLGKVSEEPSHSESGAQIASDVCDRLGVVGYEKEATVWLVKEHLTMAQIARTHDLGQPSTAIGLALLCDHRTDKLAMLYLLTVADTSSVAEHVWTPQMAAATEELYAKTRRAIGAEVQVEDPAVYRSEAVRRLQKLDTAGADIDDLLETMPTHYLLGTPVDLFPLHSDYIRRAREGETTVVFQHQPDSRTTDVTICTLDFLEPGLLSRILGVAYALDLTLHSARAASTSPSRVLAGAAAPEAPVALDVLSLSYRQNPLPPSLCRIVAADLRRSISDVNELFELLRKHGKDPDRRQAMLTYKFYEGELGVLEVETPLGRGMPYRVSKMLAELGWNVHVARIGQWAGRAVGRFYLDLPGGGRLTNEAVESALGKKS